jgi:hypothetical protein
MERNTTEAPPMIVSSLSSGVSSTSERGLQTLVVKQVFKDVEAWKQASSSFAPSGNDHPGRAQPGISSGRTEMKMFMFLLLATCLTFTAASMAQTSPSTSPDNPSRSMQQDSRPASLASSMNKGDRELTGCIRSKNEKYLLERRHHKTIWLSGPADFASQAGHTVTRMACSCPPQSSAIHAPMRRRDLLPSDKRLISR